MYISSSEERGASRLPKAEICSLVLFCILLYHVTDSFLPFSCDVYILSKVVYIYIVFF